MGSFICQSHPTCATTGPQNPLLSPPPTHTPPARLRVPRPPYSPPTHRQTCASPGPQTAAMTLGRSTTTSPSSFSLVSLRGGREASRHREEEKLQEERGRIRRASASPGDAEKDTGQGQAPQKPPANPDTHLVAATSLASVSSLCLCSRSNTGMRCTTAASRRIS